MDGAVFYSYKPYLHLALSRECIITFNENGVYIAKTPEEEKLLREYAKNIRNSYNIIEAGGELGHEDLIRLHEEAEQKLVAEAKQREKARAGFTAFSDRITGYLQQKAGSYRSSGVQEGR